MKNKFYLLSVCALIQGITFAQAPNISYTTPQTGTVGTAITPLQPTNTGGAVTYRKVTSIAGKGIYKDGLGTEACFNHPLSTAVDTQGNVYVADDNYIRKISPTGMVSTLAGNESSGSSDGPGFLASFNNPNGLAVDSQGNVYVADTNNNKIRKISPAGTVSTLAGSGVEGSTNGAGALASFNQPVGIALDTQGNVYLADTNNNKIRKISSDGTVTTLAGSGVDGATDGAGALASFSSPCGMTIDAQGNLYVIDANNSKIRKISPAGTVSTLADGNSMNNYTRSNGMAVDTQGNLYVTSYSNKITMISPAGAVSTFAGSEAQGSTDGTGALASFYNPNGLAVDSQGNVYVADTANHKIRKISPLGLVSTLAGGYYIGFDDGIGDSASFNKPYNVAVDAQGNVYVADTNNNKIRKISPEGTVTTLAGSGAQGSTDDTGTLASFNRPMGIAVDAKGNVYIADTNNAKIRKISPAGMVSTFCDHHGSSWDFYQLVGIALDAQDNVYVTDTVLNSISKISPSGVVTTLAGGGSYPDFADGTGSLARFNQPMGVALDSQGNLYVGDSGNQKIRKISPSGAVSTLAGSGIGSSDGAGISASFLHPSGVAVDAQGNVYVADTDNNSIRKIDPSGVVTTLAGLDQFYSGSLDGIGYDARFSHPRGIAIDAHGNAYVADTGNSKIRKIGGGGYTISPLLPTGLNIDPTTGEIYGIPIVASPQTTYTITAVNNFGTSTATLNITVNSNLGVEDIAFKNMVVYPNPTTGMVNINNVLVAKVNVYNTLGQLVNTVGNKEASNTTSVQLSNLPTGIYYLHIETENAHTIKQVIKQ